MRRRLGEHLPIAVEHAQEGLHHRFGHVVVAVRAGAEDDEALDALGMAGGEREGDGPRVEEADDGRALDAGGVHHVMEIGEEIVEGELDARTVGEAEAAAVVTDQRARPREVLEEGTAFVDGEVGLQVRERRRRDVDERRAGAHRGVGDAGAVARGEVADGLLRHGGIVRSAPVGAATAGGGALALARGRRVRRSRPRGQCG